MRVDSLLQLSQLVPLRTRYIAFQLFEAEFRWILDRYQGLGQLARLDRQRGKSRVVAARRLPCLVGRSQFDAVQPRQLGLRLGRVGLDCLSETWIELPAVGPRFSLQCSIKPLLCRVAELLMR